VVGSPPLLHWDQRAPVPVPHHGEHCAIVFVLLADLLALRDPLCGNLLLDTPTVLAHVAKAHGRVTAEDIAALWAKLYEKLASLAGFLTHAALFAEKSTRINLEEVIAPTALFTIFEGTFALPSFLPTLGRFYEATPDRLQHTVANLVAFLTPALSFITKLSNPFLSVFGAFGLVPPVPTDPAVVPPSPSKRALTKASRKEKQGPKLGQHDALLAYLAQQGITVPPHLVVGALTFSPVASQSSSSTTYTQDVHDCPEPGPPILLGPWLDIKPWMEQR
jgi:hypothetical protein